MAQWLVLARFKLLIGGPLDCIAKHNFSLHETEQQRRKLLP
jgi:hypothetical protein